MIRTIKIIDKPVRVVNLQTIAEALGAEEIGIKIETRYNPISLFSLRQFYYKEIMKKRNRRHVSIVEHRKNNKFHVHIYHSDHCEGLFYHRLKMNKFRNIRQTLNTSFSVNRRIS
jgi:hypothetical protein